MGRPVGPDQARRVQYRAEAWRAVQKEVMRAASAVRRPDGRLGGGARAVTWGLRRACRSCVRIKSSCRSLMIGMWSTTDVGAHRRAARAIGRTPPFASCFPAPRTLSRSTSWALQITRLETGSVSSIRSASCIPSSRHQGPRRYGRVKGGVNHGKESSKVNWDCTICASCRCTEPCWTVPQKRENQTRLAGLPFLVIWAGSGTPKTGLGFPVLPSLWAATVAKLIVP